MNSAFCLSSPVQSRSRKKLCCFTSKAPPGEKGVDGGREGIPVTADSKLCSPAPNPSSAPGPRHLQLCFFKGFQAFSFFVQQTPHLPQAEPGGWFAEGWISGAGHLWAGPHPPQATGCHLQSKAGLGVTFGVQEALGLPMSPCPPPAHLRGTHH